MSCSCTCKSGGLSMSLIMKRNSVREFLDNYERTNKQFKFQIIIDNNIFKCGISNINTFSTFGGI